MNSFKHMLNRETRLPNGDVLNETIRVVIRLVESPDSFLPKAIVKETLVRRERFSKRIWGPFSWWEHSAMAVKT